MRKYLKIDYSLLILVKSHREMRSVLMGRARCEWYKSIDIREWKREGLLSTPGNYFTVEWSGDHPLGIGVLVGDRDADLGIIGSLTLGYRVGRGQPIERPIYIAFTRPKLGGRRPWFFCPNVLAGWLSSIFVARIGLAGDARAVSRLRRVHGPHSSDP
jgi:hypothetical protein